MKIVRDDSVAANYNKDGEPIRPVKIVYSAYDLEEALRIERERIAKNVKGFLMDHYYVKSGDKYRLNHDDLEKLDAILVGGSYD